MTPKRSGPVWLRWADQPRRAIGVSAVFGLFLVGISLGLNGTERVGWHAATRITAVYAFALWLPPFCASALLALFPSSTTRALRARRRALGLAFAVALGIHGLVILRLATREPGTLTLDGGLIGGGLGFVLVSLMAATSNDASLARLGRARWKALHRVGQIFLLVAFSSAYAGRVVEDPDYWPAAALLVAALGLRIAVWIQSLRLRKIKLPTE